ncbi:WD40 repeat-like protein [Aureobasidium pullulans]|uniref:WD40 repeat-like protein n=1 Tax=Aureobasidium pullulans TaxID=5580 RepID=A0A4S9BB80_AURPU|nr:WD40 repeat-like protein [Aureobasidium pullulans]THW89423.1 WD40 repeat-like protein [Aureobasidium pullulans]THX97319.1 WD40 repeat-like protein [Aureobasidium pullulans]
MEAAIRWSPLSTPDRARFLLADVAGNALTLYEAGSLNRHGIQYKPIARREKVNNFTAFDWSKTDDSLVALGLSSGNAELYRFDGSDSSDPVALFNIKTQRRCNTIAFNTQNLLAVGLDRVRHDNCLTVYDIESNDAYSRLCVSEAVTSLRFFPNHPQQMLAAVSRQTIRLYDLRDSSTSTAGLGNCGITKLVNNIAIDPLDENYFASGGSTGDPSVTVWDKRYLSRSNNTVGADATNNGAVLDLRPATDNSQTTSVWSIRYSGQKRGRFCVLSSTGEVKLYDTAQHKVHSKLRSASVNYYGGNPWSHPHYVSRTHNLRDSETGSRKDRGANRVIAFDWISIDDQDRQAVLALHPNRDVDLIYTPDPSHISMTGRGDLSICNKALSVYEPKEQHKSVAQEIKALRKTSENASSTQDEQYTSKPPSPTNGPAQLDHRNLKSLNGSTRAVAARTEEWLDDSLSKAPEILHNKRVVDLLAISNVSRRRCQEGYLFDPRRNIEIVAEDPALVKLWGTIKRLEDLSRDGGMASETLDLSYLGVSNIWEGKLGNGPNRVTSAHNAMPERFEDVVAGILERHSLPEFAGIRTEKPEQRQLCLALCGWDFSHEHTKERCDYLVKKQRYYEAVATAMFRGRKTIALEILRDLIRERTIQNIGLGALIASDSLNDEQREMCRWMEEDATDPYLRSLLIYLASNDWLDVVHKLDADIKLSDRLGIAIKHLGDSQISTFLSQTSNSLIGAGNVEGILLTGLGEKAMELFQSYIRRTSDLQTAVLATAFTNPLYVDDPRWEMWKETYFLHMQSWRAFIERTKFSMQHTRRAVTRGGNKLIAPPPRQLALRCAHCQHSLAKENAAHTHQAHGTSTPAKGTQAQARIAGPAASAGTVCPRCGRHLPRCCLCMQWLGAPEPTRAKEVQSGEKETDVLSKFITFCASCTHGFHAHHARTWFARHAMCPVPDCRCLCGLK